MSVIHCYIMLLSLITAGVMVFLIACALIGIVALIVKHKMVATKNARGKILLLAQILTDSLFFQSQQQQKLLM